MTVKALSGPAEQFGASRSDSHTPRGTPSARANPSARSASSSTTSASHVHPSPPSSAVRPAFNAAPNGASWRHAAAQAFDAPALAIQQGGGRALLQPPQSRAMLPTKTRHVHSGPAVTGLPQVPSAASLPSSVTDLSAFEGGAEEPLAPPLRVGRTAASFDHKRHISNERSPYPSTGPHTPSGRLFYTPRCAYND